MSAKRARDKKVSDVVVPGVDVPIVDDEPLILVYCMMCKHWQQNAFNPAFGNCLLGAKSMAGPFPTTDLTSCTRAEQR